MKSHDEIALKHAEKRAKALAMAFKDAKVRPGWIHYMRAVLGMTLKKLAERSGVALPTIAQAERSEAKGTITLSNLRKIAQAMECELVYAFVPKESINEILERNAFEKAKRILAEADTHMTLEDQRVEDGLRDRVERLARTLIEKGDVW
jgi:predicted DNA-binding mobile mystery protein A